MNFYTWDEISNAVMEWKTMADIHDMWLQNREGGWETNGWQTDDKNNPTDVRILTTGKHWSLETWANSIEEAEEKFSKNKFWKLSNEE